MYGESDKMRKIVASIHKALEPFVVPNVTSVEYHKNVFTNTEIILVQIPGLGDDYICRVVLDPMRIRLSNVDGVVKHVTDVVFEKFRFNRVEPESNIILGEN